MKKTTSDLHDKFFIGLFHCGYGNTGSAWIQSEKEKCSLCGKEGIVLMIEMGEYSAGACEACLTDAYQRIRAEMADEAVKAFNERYSVGDLVAVEFDNGVKKELKIRDKALVYANHCAVVFFEGSTGAVEIDRVVGPAGGKDEPLG